MEIRYILEVVEGEPKGRRFSLRIGESVIGRGSASDICIGSEGQVVSRRHAVLTAQNDMVTVRDCGSVNFTFINGRKIIEESPLCEGDILRLGDKGPGLKLVREDSVSEAGAEIPSLLSDGSGPLGYSENGFMKSNAEVGPSQAADSKSSSGFSDIGLPRFPESSREESDAKGKNVISVSTTKEIKRIILRSLNPFLGAKYSKSQEIPLSKVSKAFREILRVILIIVGVVIAGLVGLAIHYALGYYRYESIIAKGMALKKETKQFDGQYENLRQTETVFSASRQEMLERLHDRERQLDSIRALLPARYLQRFFADSTERYLCDIMAEFNEPYYHVPQHMLDSVKKNIGLFTGRQRKYFERTISRKDKYFPYIEEQFRAAHVPKVLAYMAIEESGLDPDTVSYMGAVGLWQFMKGTALDYGLRVDSDVDERKNWRKSTDAAAKYLRKLLVMFGKGDGALLAIAAYNTGETNVRKALEKIKNPLTDRDFWYLYRNNILVEETRKYVPKILAQIIIDRHRSFYGISVQEDAGEDR